jgi:hypothetical protein
VDPEQISGWLKGGNEPRLRAAGCETLAARLAGKTAAETISVMLAVFARIEPALRKSITFRQ